MKEGWVEHFGAMVVVPKEWYTTVKIERSTQVLFDHTPYGMFKSTRLDSWSVTENRERLTALPIYKMHSNAAASHIDGYVRAALRCPLLPVSVIWIGYESGTGNWLYDIAVGHTVVQGGRMSLARGLGIRQPKLQEVPGGRP